MSSNSTNSIPSSVVCSVSSGISDAILQQQQRQQQSQQVYAAPSVAVNNTNANSASVPQYRLSSSTPQNKYGQLLAVIDDLGRDIRPSYAGSRSAQERLKKGIVLARSIVREC